MGPLSFTGGVAFPLLHGGVFALKGSAPSHSWEVRGTSSTKSKVTECVKRVMVVYTKTVLISFTFRFFALHPR